MKDEINLDDYNIDQDDVNRYVTKVFGWMFLGLIITALTTFVLLRMPNLFVAVIRNVWILFVVQIGLVMTLSLRVRTMNPGSAKLLFLLYAASNGFTIGALGLSYAPEAVVIAFALTGVSFGLMAVYGLVTNADLTKLGNLLFMGLLGVIIMSLVNIWIRNDGLDLMICIIALFIFLALTARDTQNIKKQYYEIASNPANGNLAQNVSILGALSLYLNFINIFIFILRILGRRSE